MIVKQILLISTFRNVQRTVWILIYAYTDTRVKGLGDQSLNLGVNFYDMNKWCYH